MGTNGFFVQAMNSNKSHCVLCASASGDEELLQPYNKLHWLMGKARNLALRQ